MHQLQSPSDMTLVIHIETKSGFSKPAVSKACNEYAPVSADVRDSFIRDNTAYMMKIYSD